jgi:hypothetical protein
MRDDDSRVAYLTLMARISMAESAEALRAAPRRPAELYSHSASYGCKMHHFPNTSRLRTLVSIPNERDLAGGQLECCTNSSASIVTR